MKGFRRLIVKNNKTGESFEDTANILVSAKGGLNQVAWPQIKGLKQFGGKLMHSGAWDERSVKGLLASSERKLTIRQLRSEEQTCGGHWQWIKRHSNCASHPAT
jgi:hypothetical protein